ncbi:hypothetical protein [Streptomyces sp. NPDC056661]|uniref:hypothetical protein n=1 Tax=Streptomyces sp. NPDC056661 TaxID=3345898 RepID=UPI0036D07A83
MRGVVSSRSIGRLPLGAGQSASGFCAPVLTVGSALCDLLVDGAELGVAVRVLLAFQGPGRA